jgi:hypothetical protein
MPGSMGAVGAPPPVPLPLPPPSVPPPLPPPLPGGGLTTGGAFFGVAGAAAFFGAAGAAACGGFSVWASGTDGSGATGLVIPSVKEVSSTRCLDPFRLVKPT